MMQNESAVCWRCKVSKQVDHSKMYCWLWLYCHNFTKRVGKLVPFLWVVGLRPHYGCERLHVVLASGLN